MRGCRPLTDLELSHLLEPLAPPRWRRERLLVLLGVRTGLRLSSMLQLRVGDVAIAGEVQDRIRVRRVTVKGKRSGYDLPLQTAFPPVRDSPTNPPVTGVGASIC